MKKMIFLWKFTSVMWLSFFSVVSVNSQIIPAIPTAQQQPKWFFPVFVEDATGAKDTIYYGYDPTATSNYDDTIFGEYYYPMDSGLFKACVYEFNDTYVDVQVMDSISFVNGSFNLELYNTVFPIKIWWDDISRLRSDSLPFPDPPTGVPRGQLILEIGSTTAYVTNPGKTAWGGQIIVSDSAQSAFESQRIDDTVFLADIFNNPFPQSTIIYALFKKWTGMPLVGVNELEQSRIKIFPNPVNDFLVVEEKMLNELYWIYDLNGKEIISGKIIINKIPVEFLTDGIYFLKITSKNNFYAQKFIKS